MRVRKSLSRMSDPERAAFLAALVRMKNEIANPLAPADQQISIYDQFVAIHYVVQTVRLSGGTPTDHAHFEAAFGPWHREFLIRFELALQKYDSNVMLPYWDWTDGPGNIHIIFNQFGMGPDGDDLDNNKVKTGYFAYDRPGTGSNTTPLPAWWPAGMVGWRLNSRLVFPTTNTTLRRNLEPIINLAQQAHVRATLNQPIRAVTSDAEAYLDFIGRLEAGPRMHNILHNWFGIGSHMRNPAQSPNDPMFFLHHCNCDRIWAMWQMDGHMGTSFYPTSGQSQGHNLADPMWPWVGPLGGYTSDNLTTGIVIPDFSSESTRRAADVTNHREIMLNGNNLGYSYDTQVVVGVALDRTGSMDGPTPDPLTGMPPNITKWDAAKQGVGNFLQDAEAAYQAAEAYVVAGVDTFHTVGIIRGLNMITPVSPATPPFGVVKPGSPYTQGQFSADVAPLIPTGATPLAAALTETEDQLVRPPFGNRPANEQRYLCILTDGKETAIPWLSSLSNPEFADTVIFAMGFGVGSGWDGVDYTTIDSLKNKGKAAPTGVQQAFHGENANVIDKFFTNSVAHTMGFQPVIDPRYEIFPGETVMIPFQATRGDQAFMITAQGFDYDDRNWHFDIMGPDNTMYHGPTELPFLITMVQNRARKTIFLNRNGGPEDKWVGTWNLMAIFRPRVKRQYMVMPNIWEMLVPTGAPPLRGPLFTRFDQPAAKRLAVRALPPKPEALPLQSVGINSIEPDKPSTLAVNVYVRGMLATHLTPTVIAPFAGNDIQLILRLEDLGHGKVQSIQATGRMVGPGFSLGNIFADVQTIPLARRKKYFFKRDGRQVFDEMRFLADYEKAKPEAFPLRDEEISFTAGPDGAYIARIKATDHPGVYRAALHVEGTVVRLDGSLEPIFRILNTEIALGIEPDPIMTQPTLHWLAPNKFVIRFTPTDTLGNIASPGSLPVPRLFFYGQEVLAEHRNFYDGQHELEVTLEGKRVVPSADGRYCKGEAYFRTHFSGRILIRRDQPLAFKLRLGATVMAVSIPKAVSRGKGKSVGAGTNTAMKIPVEERVVSH